MKALLRSAAIYKEHKKRLFKYQFRTILFLIISPYLVGFTSDTTSISDTIIEFLIGTEGHSRVTYDCAGNVTGMTKYSSVDYGISATHNIEAFKFGARAGGYTVLNQKSNNSSNYYYVYSNPAVENNTAVFYLNPFIGGENKYYEFNFGVAIFSGKAYSGNEYTYIPSGSVYTPPGNVGEYFILEGRIQPSWVLRIGNREKFHFSTQYLSNVPILSGGGIGDFGFGFGSTDSRNITWVGTSVGPYQNFGLCLKQNIQVSDNMDILLRGRVGVIEDNFEGGISAGLRINL